MSADASYTRQVEASRSAVLTPYDRLLDAARSVGPSGGGASLPESAAPEPVPASGGAPATVPPIPPQPPQRRRKRA